MRLKKLLIKYQSQIIYLFTGILTTAVNYAVFFPLYNLLKIHVVVCNVLAWIAAVIFAFCTNKRFVFKSGDWAARTVLSELIRFLIARAGSLVMETGLLLITTELLLWNGNLMKILVSVFVVIANYFTSKWFVFKR